MRMPHSAKTNKFWQDARAVRYVTGEYSLGGENTTQSGHLKVGGWSGGWLGRSQ